MRTVYILFLLLLSSCEPSYAVMYKISLEEEKKINGIKSILIQKENLLRKSRINCNMVILERNEETIFAFYIIGSNKRTLEMNLLIKTLIFQLNQNNIAFHVEEEIKSGNIFSCK